MIAKFVVWAPTRTLARAKMIRLLADTAIIGVRTNQKFLQSCLANDGFSDPAYTTSFIPQRTQSLLFPVRTQAEINLQQALPLVVSYALEILPRYLNSGPTARAFSNIRPKFRNQAFDTVNSGERRTIVTSNDPVSSSQVASFCAWEPNKSGSGPVKGYSASLPQPVAQKSATVATSNYNALTSAIRAGNVPDRSDYTLDVLSCEAHHSSTASSPTSWITGTMSVAVNGMVSKMYLATETSDLRATRMPDTGQGFRIMVHSPLLGTWFSFNVFSTLSYFEHLREAVGGDSQAKLKVIPAPMPCKVVSVLKKNGDKVKAGEIVMVVESMKMEINISAAVEGKFNSKVQEQDAVDEGSPLCAVE
jgi:acetyl/propionyl-CoA carboxylase alpha subunit